MKKKWLSVTLISVLFISLLGFIKIQTAYGALEPGEYIIKDILAKDFIGIPTEHPNTYDEVAEYVSSRGNMEGRTGWSAQLLYCNNDELVENAEGELTPWHIEDQTNTSDSGRDHEYEVSDYHDEIIAYLTNPEDPNAEKYDKETAELIYEAALESGKKLVYQEGTKTMKSSAHDWDVPCKDDDLGWYYNDQDFKLTLTFTVEDDSQGPGLKVIPPEQTIYVGEQAQYQAIYTKADGEKVDVTNDAVWKVMNTSYATSEGQGKFTGTAKGFTTITAVYEGKSDTAYLEVLNQGEEPEPEEPVEKNNPPVAKIDGPDVVEIGESFCLKSDSYDTDGYIEFNDWYFGGELDEDDEEGFTEETTSKCGLYYEDPGEQEVWLQVTDDDGSSDDTTHTIEVVYPVPSADFEVYGYPIENRAVWLTPDRPYGKNDTAERKFPIVENKWIIKALDSNNQSAIVVIEDDLNNSDYKEEIELLFRKQGDYEVTHYIKNNRNQSATETEIVTISEDLVPTTKVETTEVVYLNTQGKQTVTFDITSHSEDDFIGNNILEIARDQDNDGNFEDETWQLISNSPITQFNHTVTKLGNYKVRLTSIETFNEPTYESHVNLSTDLAITHRKYIQDETTFEVDNMAPVVSLNAMEEKEVEIIFNMGDVVENGKYSKTSLQTRINSKLLPALAAEGVNADVQVVEPVYYEDTHKILGTIERLHGSWSNRDDEWRYSNSTIDDDLFYSVDLYEQTITPVAFSGIPIGGAYDTKGNYYYSTEPRMESFDEKSEPQPEELFGINKYDAETGQVLQNFIPPNDLMKHLKLWINKHCAIVGSSYPRQECYQYIYDDRYTEWDTRDRPPYNEYREEVYEIHGITQHIYVSEEDNIYAIYQYERDNNRDGYDRDETHFIFLKYSPSGQLIDKGELWSDHGEGLTIVTEDFLVTSGKYDRDGDGEIEMRTYLMKDIMGGPNYSLPPKSAGPSYLAAMRADEYNVKLYDSMVMNNNLMVLYGGSGGDDYEDGSNMYLRTFTPQGTVSTKGIMNGDKVNIPVSVVDDGETEYNYATIFGSTKGAITRDGKIQAEVSYIFNTSSDWERRILGTQVIITDTNGATVEPLTGSSYRPWVDIYAEVVAPISDQARGFTIEPPVTYLPTTDIRHARILDGTYKVDYKRDFQVFSENPPALMDVLPNDGPKTPPEEIVVPGDNYNGERYRYTAFKLLTASKPVTRGDKKTLADTLADTKWKSETSTKYYVTLSDQDINDIPNDTEEVVALLNEKDIRYISIDTNITQSLAQQIRNAIEQDSLQVTTSYNDTNMDNAIKKSADFIIGDLFPPEDPTIDIHLGVDDSQYSLTSVRTAINNILKPNLINAGFTDINVTAEALVNKTVNSQSVRKFNTSKENEYYALFKDSPLSTQNLNHLVGDLLLQDSYFIGIGKQAAKTQFDTVINKNMYRGLTINEPSSINDAMEKLSNYLIDTIRVREDESVIYATTEVNKVLYEANYWDFENNPKFKEIYKTIHDPSVFEHDQGKISFPSGSLPEIFTKVGLYKPTYQAQDDPLVNYSATEKTQFADYRKWSNVAEKVKIYIHRLPIPDFIINFNKQTRAFSASNAAYDLDKQSINIGLGGGIAKQQFQWRKKGEIAWKNGLPSSPLDDVTYEIKNEVTDFQNETAYLIKEVNVIGPPVAQFTPNPSVIEQGDSVNFINTSYEATGDDMVAKWYYKKSTTSSYTLFAEGSYINGVGNLNWNPTTNALNQVGIYDIKLIVTDEDGMSDEAIQQVEVIEKTNNPPVACMSIPNPNYIGDTITIINCASDEDGDPLTYSYKVTKPNGSTTTYNTGHPNVAANGNLKIVANQHPIDLGTWTIQQTVFDGSDEASATGTMQVLDQTIQGEVAHTEQWLKNLQKYNVKNPSKAFNLNSSAGLLEFIPGERFVLNTTENTTNRLVSAKAFIKESSRGINYNSLYGTATLNRVDSKKFTGSLWDESMVEKFKDGEVLTFEFVGTFTNGWVDTHTVQIRIKDDPYWRQHTTH